MKVYIETRTKPTPKYGKMDVHQLECEGTIRELSYDWSNGLRIVIENIEKESKRT